MLKAGDFTLCSGQFRQHDFKSLVELAAKTGFRGITLGMHLYLMSRKAGLSHDDMQAILKQHNVEIAYVDGLVNWRSGPRAQATVGKGISVDYSAEDVVAAAAALGVKLINAVEVFKALTPETAVEPFGKICDLAAPHGIKICIEFTPIGNIPDLKTAYGIVAQSGRANGGVMLDTFHFKRGGSALSDIPTVPVDRYLSIQLSDTSETAPADLFKEALTSRLMPGKGTANVATILKALSDHGVRLPYDAEVMSEELSSSLSPEQFATATVAAMRTVSPRA